MSENNKNEQISAELFGHLAIILKQVSYVSNSEAGREILSTLDGNEFDNVMRINAAFGKGYEKDQNGHYHFQPDSAYANLPARNKVDLYHEFYGILNEATLRKLYSTNGRTPEDVIKINKAYDDAVKTSKELQVPWVDSARKYHAISMETSAHYEATATDARNQAQQAAAYASATKFPGDIAVAVSANITSKLADETFKAAKLAEAKRLAEYNEAKAEDEAEKKKTNLPPAAPATTVDKAAKPNPNKTLPNSKQLKLPEATISNDLLPGSAGIPSIFPAGMTAVPVTEIEKPKLSRDDINNIKSVVNDKLPNDRIILQTLGKNNPQLADRIRTDVQYNIPKKESGALEKELNNAIIAAGGDPSKNIIPDTVPYTPKLNAAIVAAFNAAKEVTDPQLQVAKQLPTPPVQPAAALPVAGDKTPAPANAEQNGLEQTVVAEKTLLASLQPEKIKRVKDILRDGKANDGEAFTILTGQKYEGEHKLPRKESEQLIGELDKFRKLRGSGDKTETIALQNLTDTLFQVKGSLQKIDPVNAAVIADLKDLIPEKGMTDLNNPYETFKSAVEKFRANGITSPKLDKIASQLEGNKIALDYIPWKSAHNLEQVGERLSKKKELNSKDQTDLANALAACSSDGWRYRDDDTSIAATAAGGKPTGTDKKLGVK